MQGKLFGCVSTPVVSIVGEWDPIAHTHVDILRRLSKHCIKKSLSSLVVLLDPSPISFLTSAKERPPYNGVEYRILQILNIGINAVLRINFKERDTNSNALALINNINSFVTMEELWLGALQSFGRGVQGSQNSIQAIASKTGFKVTVLPYKENYSSKFIHYLINGKIVHVSQVMGHGPVWKKNKSGIIRLPWPSGKYIVAYSNNPFSFLNSFKQQIELVREADDQSRLMWTDTQCKWITFLEGPGDCEDNVDEEISLFNQ